MSDGKKRGAPAKDPSARRTQKIVILLTPEEFGDIKLEAGGERLNVWARRQLLAATNPPDRGGGDE